MTPAHLNDDPCDDWSLSLFPWLKKIMTPKG